MKRYQCIKNVFYPKSDPASGRMIPTLSFKAGTVYPQRESISEGKLGPVAWPYLIDDLGTAHILSDELKDSFQELLDLNVDDVPDENYTNPMERGYTLLQPNGSFWKGCAWAILAVITIAIIIYKTITWNS